VEIDTGDGIANERTEARAARQHPRHVEPGVDTNPRALHALDGCTPERRRVEREALLCFHADDQILLDAHVTRPGEHTNSPRSAMAPLIVDVRMNRGLAVTDAG